MAAMTSDRITHRSVAALAVAAALLGSTGCGKVAEKATEKATEKVIENEIGGDVDLNTDGEGGVKIKTDEGTYEADGQGNVKIETEDGTISSSAEMPDGWPDDVPVPDDLKVQMGGSQDTPDGLLLSVQGTSSTPPAEILETLKSALSDWEISAESTMEASGGTVAGAQWTLDGRQVMLSATSGEDGETQVMIAHTAAP